MDNHWRSALTLVVLLLAVGGCTIVELKRDVTERQKRVEEKEEWKRQEDERQAALQLEKSQLLADLDRQQMTLDDLETRLTRLRTQNHGVGAATAAQRQRKQQLEEKLVQYQARVAELKRKPDLPPDERNRQIAALKDQLRTLLIIGAN
jgi:chromosome segregation ATPase